MKRYLLVIIGLALIGVAVVGYAAAWIFHADSNIGIAVFLGAILFIGIGVLCLIIGIAVAILKGPDDPPRP